MSFKRLLQQTAKQVEHLERLRDQSLPFATAIALMYMAGLTPDTWQRKLLNHSGKRALLLCSRQAGKSTVTAALALFTALIQRDALILLIAPSLRQSQELFAKVMAFYRHTGEPMALLDRSALRARFANGSRIIALPGSEKTIRGFSGVDLLVIDEASLVLDDLYYSVRPMLAVSDGRLIALTTPRGRRGFFYKEWTEGGDDWLRISVTAHDVPRISPEFLEEERRKMGDYWYSQEYLCQFNDTTTALFRHEDIQAAFSVDVDLLFPNEPFMAPMMPTDPSSEDL